MNASSVVVFYPKSMLILEFHHFMDMGRAAAATAGLRKEAGVPSLYSLRAKPAQSSTKPRQCLSNHSAVSIQILGDPIPLLGSYHLIAMRYVTNLAESGSAVCGRAGGRVG